ncbi:MAG: T9SS type A sorting domain-containing protein [Flavobacteriales bacterium]|jgi:hypothetical protein
MKKIYLLALATAFASTAFSQWKVQQSPARRNFSKSEVFSLTAKRQTLTPYAPSNRVELLNENFEGVSGTLPGALPSGWSTNVITDADGADVNAFFTNNATTANAGGYWPVAETGNNNQFAGANDDAPPCDCDMVDIYLQTPTMDFTTATNVAITFDIFHDRGFGGGDATLQVSTDGGTTFSIVTLGLDADGVAIETLPVDQDYWQTIIVPVYDLTGQASVIFRFQWSDATSWASGFAVDNVIVGELPNFDLKADKVKFGNWNYDTFGAGVWDYTQIPVTQASPVYATVVASNNGFNDQADVSASFDVTFNGTPVTGSPFAGGQVSALLPSLEKDTISVLSTFVPDAIGTVGVSVSLSSTTGDDVAANNVATNSLEMTEFTYARDAGGAQAFTDPGVSYEYGNLFDIYNNQFFGGIDYAVGAGSTAGEIVLGRVYEFQGLDDTGLPVLTDPVAETIEYEVLDADFNSVGEGNFVFLPFSSGSGTAAAELEAGKTYLVTIATSGVRTPVSGSNEWVSSWLFDDTGWGATLSIPMVRLNANASLAVDNINAVVANVGNLYPNPSNGESVMSYTLKTDAKVSVIVRDMAGRVVSTQNEGSRTAGTYSVRYNTEALSAGVYSFTLVTGDHQVTQQLVVR